MLQRIPADLKDRILEGLLARLGKDGPSKAGYLMGPRDVDRMQILYRRKTNKERDEERTKGLPADQFIEIGAITDVEINQIISQALSEPQAVEDLLQRLTNGRNVLRELPNSVQEMVKNYMKTAIPQEIEKILREAQRIQAETAQQKKDNELLLAGVKAPLPTAVPPEIAAAVKKELVKPHVYTDPPDQVEEIVRWAREHLLQVKIDKRTNKPLKSWVAMMWAKREKEEQEQRDIDAQKRAQLVSQ